MSAKTVRELFTYQPPVRPVCGAECKPIKGHPSEIPRWLLARLPNYFLDDVKWAMFRHPHTKIYIDGTYLDQKDRAKIYSFHIIPTQYVDVGGNDPETDERRRDDLLDAITMNPESQRKWYFRADEQVTETEIEEAHVDDSGKAECGICRAEMQLGATAVQLICKHVFCSYNCISTWLGHHNSCPLCRTRTKGDRWADMKIKDLGFLHHDRRHSLPGLETSILDPEQYFPLREARPHTSSTASEGNDFVDDIPIDQVRDIVAEYREGRRSGEYELMIMYSDEEYSEEGDSEDGSEMDSEEAEAVATQEEE